MPRQNLTHNRQNLPVVSVIATPIGNLADISERAVNTLENINELWCEDTRVAQKLYQALGMTAPRLKRIDAYTTADEIRKALKTAAEAGQKIGITTDAGTPGIQDPGSQVIRMIHLEFDGQIQVEVIPGPSAVTAALSISGIPEGKFSFLGFYPQGNSDRDAIFKEIQKQNFLRAFCFFESPHRILDTIDDLKNRFKNAPETEFVLAKELTKMHEKVFFGKGTEWLRSLKEKLSQETDSKGLNALGEWVLIVRISEDYLINTQSNEEWKRALTCLISCGISPKIAAKTIQENYSIAKNLAYDEALQIKKIF